MNTIKKKFKTAILDLCRWYWTHFTFKSQKCNEHFLKIFNTLTLPERLDYIYKRHAVDVKLYFKAHDGTHCCFETKWKLVTKDQLIKSIEKTIMYGFELIMLENVLVISGPIIFAAVFSHKTDQWPVYEYYLRKN